MAERVEVEQRRICWPNPDLTCLEGGCGYCNTYGYRDTASILRAVRLGKVNPVNRGNGTTGNAMRSFRYGERNGWGNAQSRRVERARA